MSLACEEISVYVIKCTLTRSLSYSWDAALRSLKPRESLSESARAPRRLSSPVSPSHAAPRPTTHTHTHTTIRTCQQSALQCTVLQ